MTASGSKSKGAGGSGVVTRVAKPTFSYSSMFLAAGTGSNVTPLDPVLASSHVSGSVKAALVLNPTQYLTVQFNPADQLPSGSSGDSLEWTWRYSYDLTAVPVRRVSLAVRWAVMFPRNVQFFIVVP